MSGSGLDAPTMSADPHNNRHIFCTAEDARLVPLAECAGYTGKK